MDKQTLSQYGWVVICILVLAALIGMSTPFGNVVRASVESTVSEMSDESENRLLDAFPETVENLQKKYDFEYYSSLSLAVNDLNNSTRDNADVNKEDAVAGIYTNDEGLDSVVLLKDTEESAAIRFSQPCIFNLGGNTLKLTTADAFLGFGIRTSYNFDAEIDGSTSGSSIVKELSNADDSYIMSIACDNFKINGGTYSLSGTYNCVCLGIRANTTASNVELNDCSVMVNNETSSGNYLTYAVSSSASKLTINNSTIKGISNNLGDTTAIIAFNSLNVNNSNLLVETNPSSSSSALSTVIWISDSDAVNINSSKLNIKTSSDNATYGIYNQGSDIDLAVSGTSISTESGGNTYGIYNPTSNAVELIKTTINSDSIKGKSFGIENAGTVNAVNSNINTSSVQSNSYGIKNNGVLTIDNCNIFADAADNTVGAHNLGYESLSIGISNSGTLTFNSGSAYGTLAGVNTHSGSKTYVNGGTFTSCSHGGFYFAHGSSGEAYIENATIKCVKASTVKSKFDTSKYSNGTLGGFYVGGGSNDYHSNISVYMNNCNISGGTSAFVLRDTDGETNNKVYISNSTIGSNKIRIDGDTHTLYIGSGNNFTKDNTNNSDCVVETDKVYIK